MAESTMIENLYGFAFRDVDNRRSDRLGTHDIKQLWQRTHEIVGLALQGLKQKEIAKILGVTPVTVSNALNSSLGRKKLSKMREERDGGYLKLNEEIRELTEKAIMTYHEIFDDEMDKYSPEQKRKTADTVMLELSGLRAPTRIDSRNINTTATLEEIEEFKKRGIQAARESGNLIDLGECNDSEE